MVGPDELEAHAAWAGGMRHLNLAVGDRVVVLEGPYRGKISEITEIMRDRAEVRLDKLVKVRVDLSSLFLLSIRPITNLFPFKCAASIRPLRSEMRGGCRTPGESALTAYLVR